MKELKGISASPGIAVGRVFYYLDENIRVPKYSIDRGEVEGEIDRYQRALELAEEEIASLRDGGAGNIEEGRFLDAHILMLKDPDFNNKVVTRIRKERQNAESMLHGVILEYVQRFKELNDPYLRERAIDFYDVSRRVLNHLLYREKISLSDLQEDVILVTYDLLPSDAVAIDKRRLKGIAMDAGGKTSHTAILARSFEIPAVLGLSNITSHVRNGDEVIIDGNSGRVIVSPDKETRERYLGILKRWQKRELDLLTLNKLAAETKDGKLVKLYANIEISDEIDSAMLHGAEGIGLFRSEFLFLDPQAFSTEEEQYRSYAEVLKKMEGRPVTIRTLDLGGDKFFSKMTEVSEEKNPLLGCRAIRYCLSHREVFRVQLRALLRASVHGNLEVMFPMVSGIEELESLLDFLREVKDELRAEGAPFKEEFPVGIMVEVPSAALTTDILAHKVDFFSIGTNDLIQYAIAVDRGNEKIAYLYEPFHPAVLRLLKMVIDKAHEAGVPVSMCGEMAGDPMAAVILLGLGLDAFSMSSAGILEVKKIIRSVSMAEAKALVKAVMDMHSYNEIDSYVKDWMGKRFDSLDS